MLVFCLSVASRPLPILTETTDDIVVILLPSYPSLSPSSAAPPVQERKRVTARTGPDRTALLYDFIFNKSQILHLFTSLLTLSTLIFSYLNCFQSFV